VKTKNAFYKGLGELRKLRQKALNEWVLRYFRFGIYTFFAGNKPDINKLFKAAVKLKASKFDKKLRLAIAVFLGSISIRELESEPKMVLKVLKTVAQNKITEAVKSLVRLIDSGHLKGSNYNGNDLQLYFLESLTELYQNAPLNTAGKSLDREIEGVLHVNISCPEYTAICYRGLWRIDSNMGWEKVNYLIDAAAQNPKIKPKREIKEFIKNSRLADMKAYLKKSFENSLDLMGISGTPSKIAVNYSAKEKWCCIQLTTETSVIYITERVGMGYCIFLVQLPIKSFVKS